MRERRLRWPIAANFEAAIRGQTVRGVERRAKYILIGFDAGTLILHLGMSGSLRLRRAPTSPPKPHDHWDMRPRQRQVLRFHDPRRFGSLHWTEADPAQHPLLAKLGAGALERRSSTREYLYRVTRKRSGRHQAIHHEFAGGRRASATSTRARRCSARGFRRAAPRAASRRAQAQALAQAIKDVLGEAIKIGGTTLARLRQRRRRARDISARSYSSMNAREQPCRVCKSPIKQFVQGQRSTYWCATCQR